MRTRRIVVSACALALLVPAAASAQPIQDPPAPPSSQSTSYADRFSVLPPEPVAATSGTDAVPVAPPHAPTATSDDATDGWRIAAVIEAAVLAACAVAAAVLLAGRRRRAPRMGH